MQTAVMIMKKEGVIMQTEEYQSPFVAQKGRDKNQTLLENMEFFPDIHLRDFQQRYKVDNGTGEDRQIQNLQNAMHRINAQLLDDYGLDTGISWLCTQVRKGYFDLADIPGPVYGNCSEKNMQYRTAIYALAKAKLVDKGRDTETVRKDQEKVELELTSDDYEKESREALRLLMNKPRISVYQI